MSTEEIEEHVGWVSGSPRNPSYVLGGGSRDWAAQLLSPERAQRFELLMHLIANLEQPLVVCGPGGIGKTTYLGLLGERAFDGWQVVTVPADSRLSYGDIIARIAKQAAMATTSESAVADYLQQQARNKGMLVLLLDDAGKLAPGVINALWQYARMHPALRLVLALRPDEAHLKTATDGVALGDCHFVDIPALTEPLCEVYLRRLSVRPPRLLMPEDVTASRARSLYQASHGVPGRIIQRLTEAPPAQARARRRTLTLVAYGCAAALAVALLVYTWYRVVTPVPVALQTELAGAQSPQPVPVEPPPLKPIQPVAQDARIDAPTKNALSGLTADPAATPGNAEKVAEAKPVGVGALAGVALATTTAKPQAEGITSLRRKGIPVPSADAQAEGIISLRREGIPVPSTDAQAEEITSLRRDGIPVPSADAQAEGITSLRREGIPVPSTDAQAEGITSLRREGIPVPSTDAQAEGITSLRRDGIPAPSASAQAEGITSLRRDGIPAPSADAQAGEITSLQRDVIRDGIPAPSADAQAGPHPSPLPQGEGDNAAPASTSIGVVGLLGVDWLLAQSPQAYTLRIMSARAPASIKALLERYPLMRGRLASFKSRNGALDWYSVYYGTFASLPEATQAAAELPAFLGKPVPRQMSLVQQEIRSTQDRRAQ